MLRSLSGAVALALFIPAFAAPAPESSRNGPVAAAGQQGTSTSSQNSQDVPHQEPGTNNPDLSKERHAAPKPSSGGTQQEEDVPHQKPKTNNPDVGKQRHHAGKKKSATSTATSSST